MARRMPALVLEIIQGETTVAAASHQSDLTPAEIEIRVEGRTQARHVKRPAGQARGRSRAVLVPAGGHAGSLWRSP